MKINFKIHFHSHLQIPPRCGRCRPQWNSRTYWGAGAGWRSHHPHPAPWHPPVTGHITQSTLQTRRPHQRAHDGAVGPPPAPTLPPPAGVDRLPGDNPETNQPLQPSSEDSGGPHRAGTERLTLLPPLCPLLHYQHTVTFLYTLFTGVWSGEIHPDVGTQSHDNVQDDNSNSPSLVERASKDRQTLFVLRPPQSCPMFYTFFVLFFFLLMSVYLIIAFLFIRVWKWLDFQ